VHCGRNAVTRDVDDRKGRRSSAMVKDVDEIAPESKIVCRPKIRSADIQAR
jgi:hypothetical protein